MARDEHRSSERYPELRHFDSRKDAQAALQAWQWKLVKLPRFWFELCAYTIGVGLFFVLIFLTLRLWFPIPMYLIGAVVFGGTAVSGTGGLNWFWRKRCRRYLREQLTARGVPICLKCGYDLRGQIEPRCPECGSPCDAETIGKNKHVE